MKSRATMICAIHGQDYKLTAGMVRGAAGLGMVSYRAWYIACIADLLPYGFFIGQTLLLQLYMVF